MPDPDLLALRLRALMLAAVTDQGRGPFYTVDTSICPGVILVLRQGPSFYVIYDAASFATTHVNVPVAFTLVLAVSGGAPRAAHRWLSVKGDPLDQEVLAPAVRALLHRNKRTPAGKALRHRLWLAERRGTIKN